MASEVFVSYSHKNADWLNTLRLTARLDTSEASIQPWVDVTKLSVGDHWSRKASEALKKTAAAIFLLSEDSLASEAIVKKEWPAIAKHYQRGAEFRLVIVRIGAVASEQAAKVLKIDVKNIISIPEGDPLPPHPDQRSFDWVRELIVSALESREIQNLRRNLRKDLPKYRIERAIGTGPITCVIKARDEELERAAAVKVLSKQQYYELFKKSVQAVAVAGEHSSTLSIYGAYLENDPPYYIKQFVEGKSLRGVLNETAGPLSIERVQKLLSAIGGAVEHAHRCDLEGLNLKPANILIQHPDEPHAQYFLSLNRYESDLIKTESGRGAMGFDLVYLPPECRVPAGVRDPKPRKADQYRLGLIAYEALIGAPRFREIARPLLEGADPATWAWPPVREERPGSLEYVSRAVDKMISRNPDLRFMTVGEAVRGLERADLDIETVRDNYRFLAETEEAQDDFFKSFYLRLLNHLKEHAPQAKDIFKKFGDLTEAAAPPEKWQRQFQVLKEAILLLVVYKAFHEEGRTLNILTRIAKHHAEHKIPSDLYEPFKRCLLETVAEKNRERSGSADLDELCGAWDRVVTPGIEYMRKFELPSKPVTIAATRSRKAGGAVKRKAKGSGAA